MTLPTTDFWLGWVLQTFAEQEGISLSTEGIDDRVYGMVISSDATLIDVIRNLAIAYNFQIIDGDPIRLVRREVNDDLTIDVEIDEAECIRRGGAPAVEINRVEPSQMPRQVEIQYIDPDRDFAYNTQTARHTAAPLTNTNVSITLDVVISSQQARDLAFDALYRIWSQQLSLRFEHPNCSIEPADIVRLTTTRGIFTCFVTRNTINMPARTNSIEATILLTEKGVTVNAAFADPFEPVTAGADTPAGPEYLIII